MPPQGFEETGCGISSGSNSALVLPDADKTMARHTEVYHKIVKLLGSYVDGMEDRSKKVFEFSTPAEIISAFKSCGAETGQPVSTDQVVQLCEVVLKYSVRTSSPLFFNQLYGRVDPIALAAEYMLATLNTNAFTYEVAPVFTTVEKTLIKRLIDVFGLPSDSEGIFVPGGSMSNIYGMHMARFRKLGKQAKKGGLVQHGKQLVGFCSEDAHYSYCKGANLLGFGTEHMLSVPVDHGAEGKGSMRVDVLEDMIKEETAKGHVPFLVGATAGTTVYGGYDDAVALRAVCDKYGMWLHLDGAWGGAAAFGSEGGEARKLAEGFPGADSISWNPHKMMGTPLQCSVFLCRVDPEGNGGLYAANSCKATYCFQEDKNFASEDLGDLTLQCSRRADSFKLWLMWQAIGDAGLAYRMDSAIALSRMFATLISDQKALKSLGCKGRFVLWRKQTPFYCNICFWYVPPALQDLADTAFWDLPDDHVDAQRIRKVAPYIKDRMQRKGTGGMMGFCGQHNLFRLVIASPIGLTEADMTSLSMAIDLEGCEYTEADA